ncbi:hypothetical protein HAX54_049459, partial [Datura stramonium]|nr:hypothetical protein [Datura stramonium]
MEEGECHRFRLEKPRLGVTDRAIEVRLVHAGRGKLAADLGKEILSSHESSYDHGTQ